MLDVSFPNNIVILETYFLTKYHFLYTSLLKRYVIDKDEMIIYLNMHILHNCDNILASLFEKVYCAMLMMRLTHNIVHNGTI